jgi:hypothetical protein
MCNRAKHNGHNTGVYHMDEESGSILDNAMVLCDPCYELAIEKNIIKSREYHHENDQVFPPIINVVAKTNANYTCQCLGCEKCLGI